jgi:hypothetical protein
VARHPGTIHTHTDGAIIGNKEWQRRRCSMLHSAADNLFITRLLQTS